MIGPWSGFFAGWSFVIGKTASCAAMALTFASYAAPAGEKPVAVAAVLVLAAVNTVGVTRTAALTKVIVVVAGGARPRGRGRLGIRRRLRRQPLIHRRHGCTAVGRAAVLRLRGVRPHRHDGRGGARSAPHDPRAIVIALSLALIVYVAIALAALATLGPDRLASSSAPLAEVAAAGGWTWTAPVVRVGAAAASSALLALVAGIGRTSLAMARTGDLPRWLAAVHPLRRSAPRGARARGHRESSDRGDRPAIRDRVLVVRRAAVLPDRQHRGVPTGCRGPLSPRAAARGHDRLRGAGRDPAVALDRRGHRGRGVGVGYRALRLRRGGPASA
jgi:APA family basic amino acid/polyamine antiporter